MADTTSTTPMGDAVAPTIEDSHMRWLKDRLDAYVVDMAPAKPITIDKGAASQLGLWRAIQFVMQKTGSEFNSLWDTLLLYVRNNRKTVFNEKYVFRFFAEVRMSKEERQCFQRLIYLMLRTCDPGTRALALKQIDFSATLSRVTDNAARQRITGYYRV